MDMASAFRAYSLDEHDAFRGKDDEGAPATEVLMFGCGALPLD